MRSAWLFGLAAAVAACGGGAVDPDGGARDPDGRAPRIDGDVTIDPDGAPHIDGDPDAPIPTPDAPEVDPPGTWRSAFFPRDWRPLDDGGAADGMGRYLPDFSYAGYHRGEVRPPIGKPATHTVDASLGDGTTDATAGIQAQITAACTAGGGVVRIPAGTYRVLLPTAASGSVLSITCSNLVVRGDGPTATRILVDDARRLRGKAVFSFNGTGSVYGAAGIATTALAADLTSPTRTFALASAPPFEVGDWIVVRTDLTDAFRAAHQMDEPTSGEPGLWPSDTFHGIHYVRQVTAIAGTTITVDAPLHLPMLLRDAARVYEVPSFLHEVGLESLAIGMKENTTSATSPDAAHDDDFGITGTAGYEVHASRAVAMARTIDGWIDDVDTFLPDGNATGAHVLSVGISFDNSVARVSIDHCDWGRPQYRGGGGNGYLFQLLGTDILVTRSSATNARHGFLINYAASGIVFHEDTVITSRMADDSHRFLAHANLYDQVDLQGGWLQTVNRGTTSTGAGFTGTQHVFWNTHVTTNHATARGCAVESAQWGHGYLIGSSAAAGATATLCPSSTSNGYWASLDPGTPTDTAEGEGMGDTLYPPSLYAAQLARRCAASGLTCPTW